MSASRPIAAMAIAFVAMLAAATAVAGDDAVADASMESSVPFMDLRAQQPITGDAAAGEALSKVCGACHGERGIGVAPAFPNLAGQSATYLYVQLKAFKAGQRRDPVMAPMAASLDDAGMRDLAAYYASLPARDSVHSAPSGPSLFADGDPARGIPPCQGCHGPDGQGPRMDTAGEANAPHPPWSTIPRLRGQSASYVAKALHDFGSGARGNSSNAAIMHGVARTLDDDDIQALAEFIEAQ